MKKIYPCLWFDSQAEQAAKFYVSVFKNSKIIDIAYYPKEAEEVSGKKAGSVMTVSFELDGQKFLGLNGGPIFKFSEAVSFVIDCKDQTEVDHYWNKLTADGGRESQCGWLVDKFGLSWQVTPTMMEELTAKGDKVKTGRMMGAMLTMQKLDIAKLQAAYDGK